MPRLNIYLNDDAHQLATRWRDKVSLSDICTRAIRDELSAREDGRDIGNLADAWAAPSSLEAELRRALRLQVVRVVEADTTDEIDVRRRLGAAAAELVDRLVPDPCTLIICGGRQIWEVVRSLHPRNIRAEILALGTELIPSRIQHVNSNAMAIIASLLYQPRATADIVTTYRTETGHYEGVTASFPNRILLSSCSAIDTETPYYTEVGNDFFSDVKSVGAVSEFAYCFLDETGREVDIGYPRPTRRLNTTGLKEWSRSDKTYVMLVAGGQKKRRAIAACVVQGLCNTVVTDVATAKFILSEIGK